MMRPCIRNHKHTQLNINTSRIQRSSNISTLRQNNTHYSYKNEISKPYRFYSDEASTQENEEESAQKQTKDEIFQNNPLIPPQKEGMDVETFLKRIGKECEEHADKFESWEDLFTMKSPILKKKGISDAYQRRWILRWAEKYRKGDPLPGEKPELPSRDLIRSVQQRRSKKRQTADYVSLKIGRARGLRELVQSGTHNTFLKPNKQMSFKQSK